MGVNELKIINTVLEESFFPKHICIGASKIISACPENVLQHKLP